MMTTSMYLEAIKLDGFGALSSWNLTSLEPGLNVFYGANGSGKTTLLQLVRGVWCGFQAARARRLLPPLKGGRPGGSLELRSSAGRFEVIRHARPNHADTLAIQLHAGSPADVTELRRFIQELNPAQVNHLFTVTGSEPTDLSDLARLAADSGIDLRANARPAHWFADRIERIAKERSELFATPTRNGRLAELEQKRERLAQQLALATAEAERVRESRRAADALQTASVGQLREEESWLSMELQAVVGELREVEDRLWATRRSTVTEVEQVQRVMTPPPSACRQEIEQLDRRIAHAQQVLRDLAQSRKDLSLTQADLVATEEPDPAAAFARQREAIARIEQQAAWLRQMATVSMHDQPLTDSCREQLRVAGELLRTQVALLCQDVSRLSASWDAYATSSELDSVDRCKLELIRRIQSWKSQRDGLLRAQADPLAATIHYRTAEERERCACHDHESATVALEEIGPRVAPQVIVREREVVISAARPGDAERRRQLESRRDQLWLQWLTAQQRRRAAELAPSAALSDPHALKTLRFEYAAVEQELADCREQWESLALLQTVLQRTQATLATEVPCPVLQRAGEFLSRMTSQRYSGFRYVEASRDLQIVSSTGATLNETALSRGALEQAILSVRLALAEELQRRGCPLPLLLDDVLADTDETRLQAAVDVLLEFSQERQLIFLTCQDHLISAFETRGVAVQTLPGSTRPVSSANASTERRATAAVALSAPTTSNESAPFPGDELLDRVQPDEPYWLQLDGAVGQTPSLGAQMARRLGALGIRTVADLIDLDPELAEVPLDGLQISAATLRRWQAEARLLVCTPDLTGRDAQLLAACQIMTPAELAECDLFELQSRVAQQRSAVTSDLSLSWLQDQVDWPSRELIAQWIRRGQRSRSLRQARERVGHIRAPQRSNASAWSAESRAAEPALRLHAVATRTNPSALAAAELSDTMTGRSWRFYLSPSSPVVDAPSIGPRMSERLAALGIVQVSQLLQRAAAEVAQRLGLKMVTAETVRQWQLQASLMCRVPQLRGHDVQILVACDIIEPEQLAVQAPEALLARVLPFVDSKEGQRLLRSAKRPDLDEMVEWIECAQHARRWRAA